MDIVDFIHEQLACATLDYPDGNFLPADPTQWMTVSRKMRLIKYIGVL